MSKSLFIRELEAGNSRSLAVFGTSLSFHLAPIWRAHLHKRFGELARVHPLGLPAQASRTGLEATQTVIAAAPDALSLEWAVNDAFLYDGEWVGARDAGISLDESRANLESMITGAQGALPAPEIWIMITHPTYDSPRNADRAGSRRPLLERYYDAARAVATKHDLRILDLHRSWTALRAVDEARFQAMVPDGVHPTPRAWREFVMPILDFELGLAPPIEADSD